MGKKKPQNLMKQFVTIFNQIKIVRILNYIIILKLKTYIKIL